MSHSRHPAWEEWEEAHPSTIVENWSPGAVRPVVADAVQWDWECALWMIVRGYGADITRVEMGWLPGKLPVDHWAYPHEGGPWYRYELPDAYILDYEHNYDIDEERLPVATNIDPVELIAYHKRTMCKQLACLEVQP